MGMLDGLLDPYDTATEGVPSYSYVNGVAVPRLPPRRPVGAGLSGSEVVPLPQARPMGLDALDSLPASGLLNNSEAVPLPPARPLQIEDPTPASQFGPGESVPLPQARPDTAPPRGDPGALPAGAKPVQGPRSPGASFLDKTSSILNNHPNMLMALGAGFAGSRNFGQGMSRAFSAAIPANKMDQAQNIQQTGIQASYQALLEAGVPRSEALAAAYNPEVFKAITARVFGKAVKWGQVGTDNYGNPRYGFIDENNQTYLPADNATKPQVRNATEVLRLPKGTHFIDWNGAERIR